MTESTTSEKVRAILDGEGVPAHVSAPIIRILEYYDDGQEACEHGILIGDWCESCNADYKAAMNDPENGTGE